MSRASGPAHIGAVTELAVHSTPRRAREDPSPTTIQCQVHRERMSERVLRSNPDKINLLPEVSGNKQEDTTIVQVSVPSEPVHQLSNEAMESTDSTLTPIVSSDLQMILQMLQKMQAETNDRLQEMNEKFTNRLEQVEQFTSGIKQNENHRTQEINEMRSQMDAIKVANATTTPAVNQSSSTGSGLNLTQQAVESVSTIHIQNHNLLRIALDKQIDELKPYFGKKQENVETWIKKIDKLAEITKMSHDEVFMLAKLKLQGDAEKWWDNKKKEIDSWSALKSKLMDTFGSLGKSNKLELEAILHRRQQNLNEPATKYWNDMMCHCSAYDENMSVQDRVWRIFNGALPEFRCKYENKAFDDVDQLLKALIQHEENRLRMSYEEQEHPAQITNLARGGRYGQDTAVWNQQQFSEAVSQVADNQQRASWNNRPKRMQESNSRSGNKNDSGSSMHPN